MAIHVYAVGCQRKTLHTEWAQNEVEFKERAAEALECRTGDIREAKIIPNSQHHDGPHVQVGVVELHGQRPTMLRDVTLILLEAPSAGQRGPPENSQDRRPLTWWRQDGNRKGQQMEDTSTTWSAMGSARRHPRHRRWTLYMGPTMDGP